MLGTMGMKELNGSVARKKRKKLKVLVDYRQYMTHVATKNYCLNCTVLHLEYMMNSSKSLNRNRDNHFVSEAGEQQEICSRKMFVPEQVLYFHLDICLPEGNF